MGRLEGVRVVAVDDDPDTLDLLCFVLATEGAAFRCVASAREALALISVDPPDVLLTDISMPDMDGYALLREVRALPPERGGRVPAAAISAHASGASRERSQERGFTVHMAKPLTPDQLVDLVLDLVGRRP